MLNHRDFVFVLLQACVTFIMLLSSYIIKVVTIRFEIGPWHTLLTGLFIYGLGILPLAFLETPSITRVISPRDSNGENRPPMLKQWAIGLVILATCAFSPLTLSISSNFAILGIQRRFSTKVDDAIIAIRYCSFASLILLFVRHCLFRSARSGQKANLGVAMLCLVLGMVASCIMALTDSVELFKAGMTLASIGSLYTLFSKPILAGWCRDDGKYAVFTGETLIEAVFRVSAALIMNWGFQGKGKDTYGRSYFLVMLTSVVAFSLLLIAGLLGRKEDIIPPSTTISTHRNVFTRDPEDIASVPDCVEPI